MTRFFATLCFGAVLVGCDRPTSLAVLPTAPTPPRVTSQPPPPANYGDFPIIGPGISISVGDVVQGTVMPGDAVCFPFWDLTGRCRQYDLTASDAGTLEVRVEWSESHRQMTAFIVHDSIGWLTSDGPGTPQEGTEARLTLPVRPDHTYHLLIMSYSPAQNFELTTALRLD